MFSFFVKLYWFNVANIMQYFDMLYQFDALFFVIFFLLQYHLHLYQHGKLRYAGLV